jgi:hypothetical protein
MIRIEEMSVRLGIASLISGHKKRARFVRVPRLQAEWELVSRPKGALHESGGVRSDAQPVSTFAERTPSALGLDPARAGL